MGKSVEHEIAKDHKDYKKLTHINGFNVYRGLLHNRYGPADLNCRTGQENYLYGECHGVHDSGTAQSIHGFYADMDGSFPAMNKDIGI